MWKKIKLFYLFESKIEFTVSLNNISVVQSLASITNTYTTAWPTVTFLL